MSMFACIVFCVVAVNLSSFCVRADKPTFREILKPFLEACTKEYPSVTTDAINKATEVGNPYLVNPCFNGCVFKKAGFLNDKGEYDADSALTNLRKMVTDDEQFTTLAEVARECLSVKDTVSDGEAGCQRGSLLSVCFVQQRHKVTL